MSTPNRRPPPSSSKKPSVLDYPIKKATKPQLSFLGIGWKNYGNCAKSVPEAFVLGPFMQGLNDPVHHKDFDCTWLKIVIFLGFLAYMHISHATFSDCNITYSYRMYLQHWTA